MSLNVGGNERTARRSRTVFFATPVIPDIALIEQPSTSTVISCVLFLMLSLFMPLLYTHNWGLSI